MEPGLRTFIEPWLSGPRLKWWRLTVPWKPRPFERPISSIESPSANWSTSTLSPTLTSPPFAPSRRISLSTRVGGVPHVEGVGAVGPRRGLLLHDDAGARLDDRHGRDRPVRGEELRHPDLLTDDSVNHHLPQSGVWSP